MPNRSSWARAYDRHSDADLAAGADLLRLPGRAALLGEERLRIGLRAQSARSCHSGSSRERSIHREYRESVRIGGIPQVGHVSIPFHGFGTGTGAESLSTRGVPSDDRTRSGAVPPLGLHAFAAAPAIERGS